MASPFPAGMDWVPVPAPMLGGLLAGFDDASELKVVLRALWHIHRKKGAPRPVRASELCADRVIAQALDLRGEALETAVAAALRSAANLGVLIRAEPRDGEPLYVLNIEPERNALEASPDLALATQETRVTETWDSPGDRPTIYSLYEENIGALTPITGERLREASERYSESWIREAIEIAVDSNARNWRYVSAILERWQTEGRGDGEPRRDPEEARQEGYRRAFEKYARRG